MVKRLIYDMLMELARRARSSCESVEEKVRFNCRHMQRRQVEPGPFSIRLHPLNRHAAAAGTLVQLDLGTTCQGPDCAAVVIDL